MLKQILYLTILSTCLSSLGLRGQSTSNAIIPSPAFKGEMPEMHAQCISVEAAQVFQAELREKANAIEVMHPEFFTMRGTGGHPLFQQPVRAKEGFDDYGFHGITNFVDHAPLDFTLEDYYCGTRTYDWTTGNHAGTDFVVWPYSWLYMDEDVMEIVAAADGVIIDKADGNFDRKCVIDGSETWNAIFLEHADGSITWYLHFKDGSVTSKGIGESVVAGEYLGTAGSSGSSNIPHLHFQVYDADDNLIDPYMGPCNDYNADSWWEDQEPYLVPGINHISTHSALYVYDCPEPEVTNELDTFNIGDTIYLLLYYRDIDFNSLTHINIYDPSNAIVSAWDFYSPWALSSVGYAYWYLISDTTYDVGDWKFEAMFGGNTYSHNFYVQEEDTIVDPPVSVADFSAAELLAISPNPASDFLSVQFESANYNNAVLEIINMEGQIITSAIWEMHSGTNVKMVDVQHLPDGMYIVHLQTASENYNKRFVHLGTD